MTSIATLCRSVLVGVFAYGGLAVAASFAAACVEGGEDGTTTTGQRVTLRAQAVLDDDASFENAFGWRIELSKLLLSSGALYFFEGHPIESAAVTPVAPSRAGDDSVLRWLLPSSAHAHPGHYDAGEARGELLGATSFDLLAGPAALGEGEGVTGVVRSARFSFNAPPRGPAAGALGSHVVLIEGTAQKGELTKLFRLTADEAEVRDAEDEPVVEGCTFEEVDIQASGTINVHVDPQEWLDQAEFDDVPDSEDGQPVQIAAESRAAKAFVRGLKKSSAFVFSFAPD